MVSSSIVKVQFGDVQSSLVIHHNETITPADCLWYTGEEITIFRGEFRGEMMAAGESNDNCSHNDFTKGNVRRQNYIQSILTLQRDHKELGINDDKGLAALSMSLTKANKKEAKEKGSKDSIEVFGCVRAPIRRCVSSDERTLSRLRVLRRSNSSSGDDDDRISNKKLGRSKSFNHESSKSQTQEKKVKKADSAPRRIIRRTLSSDGDQLYERKKATKTDTAPRRVPRRSDSKDLTDMAPRSVSRSVSSSKTRKTDRAPRRVARRSETKDLTDMAPPSKSPDAAASTTNSDSDDDEEVVENLYLSRMRNAPQRQHSSRSKSPQRRLSMSGSASVSGSLGRHSRRSKSPQRRLSGSASLSGSLSRCISRSDERRGRSRSKSPQRRLSLASGTASFSSFSHHDSSRTTGRRKRSKSPQRSLTVSTSMKSKSSRSKTPKQTVAESKSLSPIPRPRQNNIASLAA